MDSTAEAIGAAKRAPSGAGDDAAIARRIAAGDVAAWGAFFERYAPWAYRFAHHHLAGNHADAEDLCSDIMMTAARSIGRFDSRRGTLDVWLLGLARHRLARFCRRRRIEVPLVPDVATMEAHSASSVSDCASDAALQRAVVNRALASLPERQAAALIGKYVAQHTVEELSAQMGSTPKAIESLLSRARAAFRCAFSALLKDGSGGENRE
jgi:RNA polymerase sigma-70 factor (ECF subfamily)